MKHPRAFFGRIRAIFEHKISPEQDDAQYEALKTVFGMSDSQIEDLIEFAGLVSGHGLEHLIGLYCECHALTKNSRCVDCGRRYY